MTGDVEKYQVDLRTTEGDGTDWNGLGDVFIYFYSTSTDELWLWVSGDLSLQKLDSEIHKRAVGEQQRPDGDT